MLVSVKILGLNAFHGDSSVALVADGTLVFAMEEERLNRIKHWAGLPLKSALACQLEGGPDHLAISRDPKANIARKLLRVAASPGRWASALDRAKNSVQVSGAGRVLREGGIGNEKTPLHFVEHHRAHMASAFFCSPFEEAAVVSIDGFGDYSSVMWGVGKGNKIEVRGSVRFPHSLGLYYTAFTQFLGFPKYGDEYKMMGLSAYGEPRFAQQVRDVVKTEGDQVRLNLDYFTHHTTGVEMSWDGGEPRLSAAYSARMTDVFGEPRAAGSEIEQQHKDLAASVQTVLEENYLGLLNHVQKQTGQKAVCLAGGVALNCVANGMILARTNYRDVYIQPAAHDAGTAIGAALYVQHEILDQPRSFVMRHVYYGPDYSDADILKDLESSGARWHRYSEDELVARTADQIANGMIVGWFQGRMEFGPRALAGAPSLATRVHQRCRRR